MSDQNQPPRPQRPPPVRPSLTRPQRLELQASMRAQGELQPRPVAATAPARPGGPPPTGPQMPGPTRPSTARPQAPGAQGPRMTSPDDQRMRIAGPQTAGLGDPRLRLGGPQTAGPGDPRLRLGGPQTAGLGDPRLRLGGPLPIAQGDPRALGAIPKVRKPAVEQLERGVQAVSIEGHSSGSGGSGSGGSGDSKGRGGGVKNPMPTSCLPSNFKTKQGTSGKPVQLQANYFPVEAKTDWILYQYRVDFSFDDDRIALRRALLNRLKDQIGEVFFDGTIIWSVRVLVPQGQTLDYWVEHEGQRINIKIKSVGQVIEAEQKNQFYNLVIRRCMSHMDLVEIKRIHYDPQLKNVLPTEGLEIWPGYSTSMRQFEHSSLICLELTNKILRIDNALDFMTKILRENRGNREAVEKVLLGRYVMTVYNNKTVRIDEISWTLKPTMTFDKKGVPTSYVAYFQDRYQLTVRNLTQPLFVSNPTERDGRNGHNTPSHLVPEFCKLCGLTDSEKGNYKIMSAVATYTRIDPPNRVEMLQRFNRRIRDTPAAKNTFSNWNLELNPDLLRLPGRLLPPENIKVGNGATVYYKSENAEWQSVFRNKMLVPGNCTKWICIYSGDGTEIVKRFIKEVVNSSNTMGFRMANPIETVVPNTSTPTYIANLQSAIKGGPQIVMVVVPNNKGDVYHAIKKVAYVEMPNPNQVVTLTVLKKAKNLGAIAQKVSGQMCAKLGGQLWGLDIPASDIMVVGYDTWHDSLHKKVSVGAIVCSSNPRMTQFLSYAIRHESGEEMCAKFQKSLKKAIDRWKTLNGAYPKKIIIYRDGVGEGQLSQLLQVEVNPLKRMVEKTVEDVKFTYIVVSKRIMTRFFEIKPNAKPTNPCSGTVVDDYVTLPERYDFFLVSQSVRVGTINPTSYYVVKDTSGFSPDILQKLSYKLTHLYYNWPGTVRVPAVCQYAHKLAYLVGESLHQDPSDALNGVLYYL